MIRGSPSSCHRSALTVLAVAVCVLSPLSATAQTRTHFASSITSESMTAVWVARERGLFKKHGLDMQYIVMPRSPLAIAALMAGEIDTAIVGPGHLISAGTGGADRFDSDIFAFGIDRGARVRHALIRVDDNSFVSKLDQSGFVQSVWKK